MRVTNASSSSWLVGVDPMRILEDDQHGLEPGECLDLADQHFENLLFLPPRRESKGRITVGGQREQSREQRRRFLALRRAAGEDGFELIELLLDGVLACKAGGKLRLLDDGVKRRVETEGRALIAQRSVGLALEALAQHSGQS